MAFCKSQRRNTPRSCGGRNNSSTHPPLMGDRERSTRNQRRRPDGSPGRSRTCCRPACDDGASLHAVNPWCAPPSADPSRIKNKCTTLPTRCCRRLALPSFLERLGKAPHKASATEVIVFAFGLNCDYPLFKCDEQVELARDAAEPANCRTVTSSNAGDARKAFAMMSTKNRVVIAVAVGVTLVGVGVAAALTCDSNRPFYEAPAHAPPMASIASDDNCAGVGAFSAQTASAPPVLYVPEITIVASAPRHP